jgi:hypothetical protein
MHRNRIGFVSVLVASVLVSIADKIDVVLNTGFIIKPYRSLKVAVRGPVLSPTPYIHTYKHTYILSNFQTHFLTVL